MGPDPWFKKQKTVFVGFLVFLGSLAKTKDVFSWSALEGCNCLVFSRVSSSWAKGVRMCWCGNSEHSRLADGLTAREERFAKKNTRFALKKKS